MSNKNQSIHVPPVASELKTPKEALDALTNKPCIELPGDDRLISDYASELAAILRNEAIFARHEEVVCFDVVRKKLVVPQPEQLRTLAEQFCIGIEKRDSGKRLHVVNRTMSSDVARAVIVSRQFLNGLRPLARVNQCRQPVLRPNDCIELLPKGYDEGKQILTLNPGFAFDEHMPLEEAKATLDELLREFCFVNESRDKAVVVAAMVGLFADGLLPPRSLRPCFIVVANGEGAGKTLLVKVIIFPTLGTVPTGSRPEREEEFEKVLLTAVREAAPVVFLDNLKGQLASPRLEAFITSEIWRGRLLGKNETYTGENLATVYVTGNGVTVSPDLRRRSLFVELHLAVERAEDRVYLQRLDDELLQMLRPKALSALWSLVRHWDGCGRPSPSRSHSAFPAWAKVIGGIVEAAGWGCCLDTADIRAGADTDGADMRRLVESMAQRRESLTFSELVELAAELVCFEHTLGIIDSAPSLGELAPDFRIGVKLKPAQCSKLGRLFERYNGRQVGNYRFVITGKGHNKRFSVQLVQAPVPQVPT